MRWLRISLLFTMILLYAGTINRVPAQSNGATSASIVGIIKDNSGAVIPSANITARQIETNLTRTIQTQEDGSYTLVQLPPGNYEIRVEVEGFRTKVAKTYLDLGVSILFSCSLEVSTANEVIEINATNEVGFDPTKTQTSTNIDSTRIATLPINRRDFLDFTLTTPRAVKDRTPGVGVIASTGLSFNGQSGRFNNVTIDGFDNNETITGAVRATFSQDAVQEFQVTSDSFSAEFGRALGGVINIVTKGGTNDLHGSLFFLNRNDSIGARDVFVTKKSPFRQYQFGATIGGPIKKDRTFFFGSFERLSIKRSEIVTISDDTVQAARNAGFLFNNGANPVAINATTLLARLNTSLTTNNQFAARYNFSGSYDGALEPFGGLIAQSNSGTQILKDSSLALSNTYLNSRLNLINETRFLYGRRNQNLTSPDPGPRVQINAPEGLVLLGRASLLPQPRKENFYQLANNVTLIRNKNQLKFGIDYIVIPPNTDGTQVSLFAGGTAFFQSLNFADLLSMPGLPTFTSLEALDPNRRTPQQKVFLNVLSQQLPQLIPNFPTLPLADISLPQFFAQGFGNPQVSVGQKQLATFIQDDIKVTPHLLVKLGLRYDLDRVKFAPKNNGDFSPRLAFSYQPSEKINIHAGYGIFFGSQLFGLASLVQLTSIKQAIKVPVLLFPFSLVPFSLPGHKFPDSSSLPPGVTFTPQLSTIFSYDRNLRSGYTQQINAGVDYLLKNNTILAANYSFVRGIKLLSVRNINPVVRPVASPVDSLLNGRVDTSQGDNFEYESAYDSYFHGITLSVNQRFSERFSLFAHYTFSKAIDNFIDISSVAQERINSFKLRDERALSLQDVRHRFVITGLGESPAQNKFLRDFKLSTIITLESGKPYNLLAGVDLNQDGDSPPGDRPQVGGVSIGRNAGITPGFINVDLRLTRKFSLHERYKLEGIAEVFNLCNTTNISNLNRTFAPDAQGNFNLPNKQNGRFSAPSNRYLGAFPARQFQLGFRLNF